MGKMSFFWFRRDLRRDDNAGLYHALKAGAPILPVFIFDTSILGGLKDPTDARVQFIYERVAELKAELQELDSDLLVRYGKPIEIWTSLLQEYQPRALYINHDYEPASLRRDHAIEKLCQNRGVEFHSFKDQVIFEKEEILSESQKIYTVYTPYKKKWLKSLSPFYLASYQTEHYEKNYFISKKREVLLGMKELGFQTKNRLFPDSDVSPKLLKHYAERRDFPALEKGTSHLGMHLRFGTVSVRKMARLAKKHSETWLSELIWREFFMQVLYHHPQVEKCSFRAEFENVSWRTKKSEFDRWCEGQTGYPMVDAGMRELNATGYMHNRVRMVTASFLTKHLLMHWSLGEAYFAQKLWDYELAANNGNWQWAAGTGCDAAPYFRIFNPSAQAKRFDKDGEYIRKWVPEWGTEKYPEPMVDHKEARERALAAFKKAVKR